MELVQLQVAKCGIFNGFSLYIMKFSYIYIYIYIYTFIIELTLLHSSIKFLKDFDLRDALASTTNKEFEWTKPSFEHIYQNVPHMTLNTISVIFVHQVQLCYNHKYSEP